MKKVLSLVLAVMMVVGMTTVAFAAPAKYTLTFTAGTDRAFGTPTATPDDKFTADTTVTAGTLQAFGKDAWGDWSATPLAAADYRVTKVTTPAFGTAGAGTITVEVEFTKAGEYKVAPNAAVPAVYKKVDASKPAGFTWEAITGGITVAAKEVGAPAETPETPSTGSSKYVDSKYKIDSFSDKGTFAPSGSKQIGEGSASINKEDFFNITSEMFNWVDSKGNDVDVPAGLKLRSSHLSNVNVRKVYQKNAGTSTIRDVVMQESDSRVRVRTTQFYAKTGDTDVELKIALTFKSKTSDVLEHSYNFTMNNETEMIEEGQNEAYSYGNYVLKADATVRDVQFEGDEDGIVYATKTVVKGQKYYFNVDSEISDADSKIIAENPEVDSIYTVYSVNMANASVQFKNLDREYFVYDAEGKLLGTTKDSKLPLAGKYILTTAKVDFGGDEEVVDEPTESTEPEVEAPPMGGGEVAPSNNYNPNTGL